MWLTKGNTKTGPRVWLWNIPADLACPSASEICLALCYGLSGLFQIGDWQKKYADNYEFSKTDEFVPALIEEIRREVRSSEIVRIHDIGDFYSAEYVRKWLEIVRTCPDTQFYAYTRSWWVEETSDPELLDALVALAGEPNFQMWWSFDRSMPIPPMIDGIRTCYLMCNDDDQPPCPLDRCFRDNPPSKMPTTDNGSLVCPYENGNGEDVTCSNCKFPCWASPKESKQKGDQS